MSPVICHWFTYIQWHFLSLWEPVVTTWPPAVADWVLDRSPPGTSREPHKAWLTDWQSPAHTRAQAGKHTCICTHRLTPPTVLQLTCSPKARHTLHKTVTLLRVWFFFPFLSFPFSFFPKHKIIFHPSSLYMLHGSFEMNNGNHRAKGSWDPFKNVGEATQSGFGPQKHHAPSKWICYCSVRYGTASVSRRQPANTSAFHDGRSGTAVREGRQTGGKGLETISYSAFLSMPSTAPCNSRRGITISSVLTASLKQTNWTWFVMCSFLFHYVVSNSTSPPQILKNRMWACTWVSECRAVL